MLKEETKPDNQQPQSTISNLQSTIKREGKLLSGSLVLLVSNLGGATLGFLVSISVARLLSERTFGQYAFVTAVILTIDGAAEAGLDSLLTRDVAANPARSSRYLWLMLRFKLALWLLIAAGLLIYTTVAPLEPVVRDALRVAALTALPILLNSSFISLFRAWQRMSVILALNLSALALQLLLYLATILLGGGLPHLLLMFFVAQASLTVACYIAYRRLVPGGDAEKVVPGELIRRALPFAVSGGIQVLGNSVDLFMINALFSPLEVGYYAIALRFYNGLRHPPNALFGALFPNLSERAALSIPQLNRTFRLGLGLLAGYTLVAASVFTLIATPLIALTYGDLYANAAHILRALIWVNLPFLLNAACLFYLYARNDERWATAIIATNFGLRLTLVAGFTVWRGPVGTAIGFALAEAATLTLYALRVRYVVRRGGFVHHSAASPLPQPLPREGEGE